MTEAYFELFEHAPSALSIIDKNGKLKKANARFCYLHGCSLESIIGKTLHEAGFLTAEDWFSFHEPLLTSASSLPPIEIPYTNPATIIKWARLSTSIIRLGEDECYLVCTEDITGTKSVEEKSNYMENIIHHLPAMVYNFYLKADNTMGFDYVSYGCLELSGYQPDEMIEKLSLIFEQIHPEDLPLFIKSIMESAQNLSVWNSEHRFKHKDGHYMWIKGKSIPYKKDADGTIWWIGSLFDISAGKKMKEEKTRLERKLQYAIEYTPNVAIQWYKRNGEIIYWNKSSEIMYGYTAEEAIGKTADKLILSSEEHLLFLQLIKQIEESGQPMAPFESLVRHKNGSERTVLASAYLIPDEDSEPVFVCMDFDITEQKKAQKALIESEGRLRAITKLSPDVVWILGKGGRIEYKSKDSEFINGYTGEIFSLDSILAADRPKVKELLENLWKSKGEVFGTECRIADGEGFKWMKIIGSNQSENLSIKGLMILTRNITEQKNFEDEIREGNSFRQILLDSIPVMVCWKDVNSVYMGGNKLFLNLVNLPSAKELIGKRDEELFSKESAENFKYLDKDVIMNREARFYYEDQTVVNGQTKWLMKSKSPIMDSSGKIIGILVTGQDITERKEAEEILQHKNEELVKINTELDRFVYSASHDLRAPISSLVGLIDVAKQENKPEFFGLYLDKQKKALKKMDDFIQEIVHYSRNGRLEVETEEVDLSHTVLEIFDQYNYLENAHMIEKTVSITGDVPFYTDRQRINIVLNNLISNGLKYADLKKTNPFLKVNARIDKDVAIITVSDNGEGIQELYLEKIFDMFFRASVNSSGSGIGLYIVKEVINKLKGVIEIDSKPGKGADFTLTIPNKRQA